MEKIKYEIVETACFPNKFKVIPSRQNKSFYLEYNDGRYYHPTEEKAIDFIIKIGGDLA